MRHGWPCSYAIDCCAASRFHGFDSRMEQVFSLQAVVSSLAVKKKNINAPTVRNSYCVETFF